MEYTTCTTCKGQRYMDGERCFDCNGFGSHAEPLDESYRDIDLEGDASMDAWSDEGDDGP